MDTLNYALRSWSLVYNLILVYILYNTGFTTFYATYQKRSGFYVATVNNIDGKESVWDIGNRRDFQLDSLSYSCGVLYQ